MPQVSQSEEFNIDAYPLKNLIKEVVDANVTSKRKDIKGTIERMLIEKIERGFGLQQTTKLMKTEYIGIRNFLQILTSDIIRVLETEKEEGVENQFEQAKAESTDDVEVKEPERKLTIVLGSEDKEELKQFLKNELSRLEFTEAEHNELLLYIQDVTGILIEDMKSNVRTIKKKIIYDCMSYLYAQYFGMKFYIMRLQMLLNPTDADKEKLALSTAYSVNEILSTELFLDLLDEEKEEFNLKLSVANELFARLMKSTYMQKKYAPLRETYISFGELLEQFINVVDFNASYNTIEDVLKSTDRIVCEEFEYDENECPVEFQGIFNMASHLTKNIIHRSKYCASIKQGIFQDDDDELTKYELSEFQFPEIGSFNTEVGVKAIELFMLKSWTYKEPWKYSVQFIGGFSDKCSDYYIYEVKWCIPTNAFPIAQATASVFFKVEVSRIKPKKCPVLVTFRFEGNSYEHSTTSSDVVFQEDWLNMIIDSKLLLFKRLRF